MADCICIRAAFYAVCLLLYVRFKHICSLPRDLTRSPTHTPDNRKHNFFTVTVIPSCHIVKFGLRKRLVFLWLTVKAFF